MHCRFKAHLTSTQQHMNSRTIKNYETSQYRTRTELEALDLKLTDRQNVFVAFYKTENKRKLDLYQFRIHDVLTTTEKS